MVKIINSLGDVKVGKQGEVVYQRHYGQQMRRTVQPKSGQVSKPQKQQRIRFQQALASRASLSRDARIYLDGYAIAHRIVDSYGIPLTWDKIALKIALEKPRLRLL